MKRFLTLPLGYLRLLIVFSVAIFAGAAFYGFDEGWANDFFKTMEAVLFFPLFLVATFWGIARILLWVMDGFKNQPETD